MNDGPWSYENHTLVCRAVPEGMLPGNVVLDSVDMWVQLHGLPFGYTSSLILEQIGNFLGVFVKHDERFSDAPWLDFYRIRVALLVDKPIKRRMKLLKRDKSWCWITFKYERLHNYCFFCGMMGHVHKFCLKAREERIPIEQYPFGPDLRAGLRRGPRGVGDSWLVPVGGWPRVDDGLASASASRELESAVAVAPQRNNVEVPIVAVSKRRREGSGGGTRRQGSGSVDVVMTEVPKNLHVAGAGSQARPSS